MREFANPIHIAQSIQHLGALLNLLELPRGDTHPAHFANPAGSVKEQNWHLSRYPRLEPLSGADHCDRGGT